MASGNKSLKNLLQEGKESGFVALEDLISFKRKNVTFCEIGYGNTIQFECDRTGHIEVFGEIQGDAGSHILKFEFMTDQTVFPQFINELKGL